MAILPTRRIVIEENLHTPTAALLAMAFSIGPLVLALQVLGDVVSLVLRLAAWALYRGAARPLWVSKDCSVEPVAGARGADGLHLRHPSPAKIGIATGSGPRILVEVFCEDPASTTGWASRREPGARASTKPCSTGGRPGWTVVFPKQRKCL